MRLRITRQLPPRFNGFETQPYQVNHVYEIGRALGDLLIEYRFAAPEQSPPGSAAPDRNRRTGSTDLAPRTR